MLITFFPFPNSSEIFPTYSATQLHIFFLLKKKYMGGGACACHPVCVEVRGWVCGIFHRVGSRDQA